MKKIFPKSIKVICFLCMFSISFSYAQSVLHYRWADDEDIYTRNIDYANQYEKSIDVLYFGTSEIYAGIYPIVIYKENGITGYNFAVSYRSAVTAYYQLLYALKYQTPKIVVCDFCSLFDDSLPSEREPLYRKIYDTMPDKDIKREFLNDIIRLDNTQNRLTWMFPLLRYHSIWNELDDDNFQKDYIYHESHQIYKKGCLIVDKEYQGEKVEITKNLWETDDTTEELSKISVEFYDKFIDECHLKGIEVVAINPPKLSDAKKMTSRYKKMKEYYDSRNVRFFNYNTYENVVNMGLNCDEHFYNISHLNKNGATIFSKQLANDLMKEYSISTDKSQEIIDSWNESAKIYDGE